MKKIPTTGTPGVPSYRMKKAAALLLTALLLIGSLAGCGKQNAQGRNESSDGSLKKVTLNEVAHSIFYAPMYVAIEEGYFKEEGIELTLVTGFGVIYLVQKYCFILYETGNRVTPAACKSVIKFVCCSPHTI